MDELPYLVSSCPSLPSVLQAWVDHEAKDAGLVVAVAGSAQHMMQGLVLDAGAPLYGRATEMIRLGPLPAWWAGPALGLSKKVDCVQAYSIWGGVPRYLELASGVSADLEDTIDRLVLDPLGPLHDEPDRILASELPSASSLRPLLDVIGAGAHRSSEIAGRLGQPATSLSRQLLRLVQLGLVVREQPFTESERSGKKSLYKIGDPFFRFWFKVVAPRRALLSAA